MNKSFPFYSITGFNFTENREFWQKSAELGNLKDVCFLEFWKYLSQSCYDAHIIVPVDYLIKLLEDDKLNNPNSKVIVKPRYSLFTLKERILGDEANIKEEFKYDLTHHCIP